MLYIFAHECKEEQGLGGGGAEIILTKEKYRAEHKERSHEVQTFSGVFRPLGSIYTVTYCKKWVNTSWTDSSYE